MGKTHCFLSTEYPPVPLSEAHFVCIPVPLEKSVSYGKGTSLGPGAILEASDQLEAWELGYEPGKEGIHTTEPIDCEQPIEAVFEMTEQICSEAISRKAVPILLGGEHTVTIGALRAFAKCKELPGIIQFDAHADLRDSYEGSLFSHACVMHRAVKDLGFRLLQFGVREFSKEEAEARKRYLVSHYDADMLYADGCPSPVVPDDFPQTVYISFDVDGFDSSLMPATGTPSPGGLFWHEVRTIITRIAAIRHIVGFDVVELAPRVGLHSCDFIAAKLVHMMMALTLRSEANAC